MVVAVVWALPSGIRSAWQGTTQRSASGGAPNDLRGARALPVVQGRVEGCLTCHRTMSGFAPAHDPAAIGCSSCHLGNTATIDKTVAHQGMLLIPGNLSDASRSCGAAQCHPAEIDRVNRSIMTTMAGAISVDRAVFGEGGPSGTLPHVDRLGHTPADTHLRQLCASCHLGAAKTTWGPVREDSRGGGCNACHLTYSATAAGELRRYEQSAGRSERNVPTEHPALSIRVGNEHCFGCHSRSGRISTNYEGWMERATSVAASATAGMSRTLADGRVFERVEPDVHFTRQLSCVDCHTAREVMGDGVVHARQHEQREVTCTDCHLVQAPRTAAPTALDAESMRLLSLRPQPVEGRRFLSARATGTPLLNAHIDGAAAPVLALKRDGAERALKPPAVVCVQGGGHTRLSCESCHTRWAPRCGSCHTAFDPRSSAIDQMTGQSMAGEWVETSGDYRAAPPTLGVRTATGRDGRAVTSIDTFVPGMVLTIARGGAGVTFNRLYARASSHTTTRVGRSCDSCHSDPEALGYGRGVLTYIRVGASGRWSFAPALAPNVADGLPADAWIPFLGARTGAVSTRSDVRPFSVGEQRSILTVGACLTCHAGASAVMRAAIVNWRATLARATDQCRLPVWDATPQTR